MKKRRLRKWVKALLAIVLAVCVMAICGKAVKADSLDKTWVKQGDLSYWIEDNSIQGRPGDPKNIWDALYGIERGREIYDPASDGWYWLDACRGGAKADNKEVWMPYVYQDEEPGSTDGKWVIYDGNGMMIKGWLYRADKDAWYYLSKTTGAMSKGRKPFGRDDCLIYPFDKKTGVLTDSLGKKVGYTKGWEMIKSALHAWDIYYSLDVINGSWLIQENIVFPGQLDSGID